FRLQNGVKGNEQIFNDPFENEGDDGNKDQVREELIQVIHGATPPEKPIFHDRCQMGICIYISNIFQRQRFSSINFSANSYTANSCARNFPGQYKPPRRGFFPDSLRTYAPFHPSAYTGGERGSFYEAKS